MTHVPWHPEDIQYESENEIEEIHGIDSVELLSVGIDIGTTTTHLLFSRILARRRGSGYSSNFDVVEREQIYESPVRLTPYEDETTIDTDAIDAFIRENYEEAGVTPGDVDTGAVIVTGEASRKENAAAITNLFSEQFGKFVCATAGPDLEALMSAHGSGAVDRSVTDELDILHIDIGGGTTKFAYVVDGFVEETASINVGAHLVEFDAEGRITKAEEAARKIAEDVGVSVEPGTTLADAERDVLAERFAELIFEVVENDLSQLGEELLVTAPPDPVEFDVLTFAGGVSDYIFDRDPPYDGDLGTDLGRAVESRSRDGGYDVVDLGTGIRATVVGSTQHKVQVSGNTITVTDEDVLPIRNLRMVPFVAETPDTAHGDGHDHEDGHGHHNEDGHSHHDDDLATRHSHDHYTGVDGDDLAGGVVAKLDRYEIGSLEEGFAFGFHLHGLPTYDRLSSIADAVIEGWERFDGENQIVVAFDSDIAMNAGRIIADRVDVPVVVLDGITLEQFGYLDVGEPLEETGAVPVTVKSLVFEG